MAKYICKKFNIINHQENIRKPEGNITLYLLKYLLSKDKKNSISTKKENKQK